MISAIILAAGESRRMGNKNKLLIPIGGEALVVKLVKSVFASDVDQVLVVIGHEAEKIRSELNDFPLKFVHNPNFNKGMTSSIKSGVKAIPNDCDGFFVCMADMPLISTSEINKLIHAYIQKRIKGKRLIVIPVFHKQRGNPVLFSCEFRRDILEHKKEFGCKGVIKNNSESVKEIEMDNGNILLDVDTMEDLKIVSEEFVTKLRR